LAATLEHPCSNPHPDQNAHLLIFIFIPFKCSLLLGAIL
jgi:hypothetical protein